MQFYAGGYADIGQEGIIRFWVDVPSGRWEKRIVCTALQSPSWLLYAGGLLYSVQERQPEGQVSVLRERDGELVPICSLPSGGADPCHLCLGQGRLFAANYTSGSLALFPLDGAGLPRSPLLCRHEGHGPDPIRQERAHVHACYLKGDILYVCDLGLDRIFCYRLAADTALPPVAGEQIPLPPGSGPRHLCFAPGHPGRMYVACEMGSLICLMERRGGRWELQQQISTLPSGFLGENTAAAVRMSADGRFLLASNRGDDSIALFSVGEGGRLALQGHCKTGGKVPRDFALFGEYVVAANQRSDSLSILRLDSREGRLLDTGMRLPMRQPACICPVPAV